MTPEDSNTVYESLGELHAKVDTLLERGSDHETRIRSVEKKLNMLQGIGAVISAVFGWIISR